MFLVLRAAARAEGCVMWLDAKCSRQQIRAQIRAEKRLLLRSGLRSACPR